MLCRGTAPGKLCCLCCCHMCGPTSRAKHLHAHTGSPHLAGFFSYAGCPSSGLQLSVANLDVLSGCDKTAAAAAAAANLAHQVRFPGQSSKEDMAPGSQCKGKELMAAAQAPATLVNTGDTLSKGAAHSAA